MKKIILPPILNTIYLKLQNNLLNRFYVRQIGLLVLFLFASAISYAQTPNLVIPIVSGGGPFSSDNLTARTSFGGFSAVGDLTDANTTDNAASLGLLGLLGAWIEVDYSGGTFPQGSEVGFIVSRGLLSASLLGGVTLSTYNTASGSGGLVSTSSVNDLIGLSVAGGREKLSFVSVGAGSFRRIRLTFSGINISALTSILGSGASVNVYNAEVLVPQAATLSSTCNTTNPLNQGAFPAVATYGTTGLVGAGGLAAADVAGILNKIQNAEYITSPSTTDYASLSAVNASVAGNGYISVKLLAGVIPENYYAGFEIQNINGLLSDVNLLNGVRIEALYNGALVQSMTAFQILSASVLSGSSSGRHTLGFVVTAGSFNEIRLVLTSGILSAGASLGETRIYNAVVHNFCAPTAPLWGLTVLANGHASTNGMTVAVNGASSGLANATLLNTESFSGSLGNLVDNDVTNYVSLSSTLGIGAGSTAAVAVTTPNYTFTGDEYAGFIVKAATPLINVGLLTGLTISTHNNGNPIAVEEASVSNSLLELNVLNVLSINGDLPPDAQVLYFKTTRDFDEVRLTTNNLAGVGNELQVYSAFVNANVALPVSFGNVSAVLQGNNLQVNWSTLSETNNKEFIVQGSSNGSSWLTIGTVASKAGGGNSNGSIDYSFNTTVQELLVLSAFSLPVAIALVVVALMLLPAINRKRAFWMTPVIAIGIALVSFSCNKSQDSYETGGRPVSYIRIAQVDKDGKISYSKAVKVIQQ
ncbi:hypothetical protein ACTJIJ_10045 [Niabella sp. 22666]|uniref:hypothetical protein n=1 Tax=Niabella sp. 22666 TaxID=3453954 RepID=UPI003F878B58